MVNAQERLAIICNLGLSSGTPKWKQIIKGLYWCHYQVSASRGWSRTASLIQVIGSLNRWFSHSQVSQPEPWRQLKKRLFSTPYTGDQQSPVKCPSCKRNRVLCDTQAGLPLSKLNIEGMNLKPHQVPTDVTVMGDWGVLVLLDCKPPKGKAHVSVNSYLSVTRLTDDHYPCSLWGKLRPGGKGKRGQRYCPGPRGKIDVNHRVKFLVPLAINPANYIRCVWGLTWGWYS